MEYYDYIINNLAEYVSLIIKDKRFIPNNDCKKDNINAPYGVIDRFLEYIDDYNTRDYNARNSRDFSVIKDFCLRHSEYIYNHLWHSLNMNNNSLENARYFFRGHNDSSYLLSPGIYRSATRKDENYFFKEMQVRCAMQLSQGNLLDKLVYLQHYECPTRLLDITSNPLVALYFACKGAKNKEGIVYSFRIREEDLLYPNSDRAQMLSHLCEFNANDQEQIMAHAILSSTSKFKKYKSGEFYNDIIERLYHAIKRETPAFEREMHPFDLLRPAFIQVAKSNPRIVKQDGAFIISGLAVDDNDCDSKIKKYVSQRLIIPVDAKARLLEELDLIGICEATLFPEVDKVASYLKQ